MKWIERETKNERKREREKKESHAWTLCRFFLACRVSILAISIHSFPSPCKYIPLAWQRWMTLHVQPLTKADVYTLTCVRVCVCVCAIVKEEDERSECLWMSENEGKILERKFCFKLSTFHNVIKTDKEKQRCWNLNLQNDVTYHFKKFRVIWFIFSILSF